MLAGVATFRHAGSPDRSFLRRRLPNKNLTCSKEANGAAVGAFTI